MNRKAKKEGQQAYTEYSSLQSLLSVNRRLKKMLKVNKLKIMNHKFFKYRIKEIKRSIMKVREHDID